MGEVAKVGATLGAFMGAYVRMAREFDAALKAGFEKARRPMTREEGAVRLEALRVGTHRRRIDHERSLGRAYVGVLLDDLCRDYGISPSVWRNPSEEKR